MKHKKRLKKLDKAIYNVLSGKKTVRIAFFGLIERTLRLRTLMLGALALIAIVLVVAWWAGGGQRADTKERELYDTPAPAAAPTPAPPSPTPSPSPVPTPSPTPNPYAPLSPDEHDERVTMLQERLMELDYMEEDEPTDFYGRITKYAVQLFQREHSLQIDGIAGETTLRTLYGSDAKPYVTRLNDRGTDVKEFQKRLRELRYLSSKATGLFGTDTEAAVKAFQKRNNLKADGKIGAKTREAIYDEDAVSAPQRRSSSGSGSKTKRAARPAIHPPNGDNAAAMIKYARAYLGYPYDRGGKGPTEFDCSGFVYWCLKNNGLSIKYMTSSAWANSPYPTVDSFSKLEPGDILCYRGHVGIYMGGGQMIDASSSNGKVRIASNISKSSYWSRNFICAKRVY